MNIHEYQAKEIFRKFSIPVPDGYMASSSIEVQSATRKLKSEVLVVKAQIHAGGRGKAGGVKLARSKDEALKFAGDMLGSTLVTHQTGPEGQKVHKVYIEEVSDIKKEYYLSIVIDPRSGRPTLIFSSEGGMDIEEVSKNHPYKIRTIHIDPVYGFESFYGRKLGFNFGLELAKTNKIISIIKNLYDVFIKTDASQIEINPLVETKSDSFVALDAKISLDDNALYRHLDLKELRDYNEEVQEEIEASKYGLSYIKMGGNIGCMVNGAGLAMATMDIIKYYGAEPANFLDVGGGASRETITEAFKIILSDKKVKGILVNIFGGIMRCDVIASGIVEVKKEMGINVPLVVRLSGTNFKEGKEILQDAGLNIVAADELDEAAQKIVNIVKYNICLF